MDQIFIHENRKLLKEHLETLVDNPSTVKAYESCLFNLCKHAGKTDMLAFLLSEDSVDGIISLVLEKYTNDNTRNGILSALHKCTGFVKYQETCVPIRERIKAAYSEQQMSAERKEKAKTMPEIRAIYEDMLRDFTQARSNDKNKIKYATYALMLGLMTGVHEECKPRRLQDYYEMLLHEEDEEKNHFIENRTKMRFNLHKMSKRSKKDVIELAVPEELRPAVEFLASIEPKRTHLLMNAKEKPYTAQTLRDQLTRLIGFSCDLIRSLYLTEKYKDVPAIAEMQKTAAQMGHTVSTALICYVKKDVV